VSVFDQALEWQARADHARNLAERLTDPGAKRALLQAAKGYDYLASAAAIRTKKPDFASGSISDLSE
jgi:hypothetical protein